MKVGNIDEDSEIILQLSIFSVTMDEVIYTESYSPEKKRITQKMNRV